MSGDTQNAGLKRLKMHSWRRGMREMDLILGPFADAHLVNMDAADLASYDALLQENDQDLYRWISGQTPVPASRKAMLDRIISHCETR